MSKIKPIYSGNEILQYTFFCPGCKKLHFVSVKGNIVWDFNGDIEKPTFSPSILTWLPIKDYEKYRCHSFIKDGKIQFLGDCWHELKGQTVDLPSDNWEPWIENKIKKKLIELKDSKIRFSIVID